MNLSCLFPLWADYRYLELVNADFSNKNGKRGQNSGSLCLTLQTLLINGSWLTSIFSMSTFMAITSWLSSSVIRTRSSSSQMRSSVMRLCKVPSFTARASWNVCAKGQSQILKVHLKYGPKALNFQHVLASDQCWAHIYKSLKKPQQDPSKKLLWPASHVLVIYPQIMKNNGKNTTSISCGCSLLAASSNLYFRKFKLSRSAWNRAETSNQIKTMENACQHHFWDINQWIIGTLCGSLRLKSVGPAFVCRVP